jgi:hypothetical protein
MWSLVLAIAVLLAGAAGASFAMASPEVADGLEAVPAPQMTVYATPTCGCCGAWVEHMRDNGFTVDVVYRDDLEPIRRLRKLPPALTSCHLGVVDGYAVEGHVPAEVVHRLLKDRPEILGVAAPGMPAGSPGMEMPNGFKQPYDIVSGDENGPVGVVASYR